MSENFEALKALIARMRTESYQRKQSAMEQMQENDLIIPLPEGVQLLEQENYLEIIGTSESLISFTEYLKSMELAEPGEIFRFGDYFFAVTDEEVNASKDDHLFMLPPDDWLMMGCKFADTIYGYDMNPYLFFSSPFNSDELPYGIQLTVTDREIQAYDFPG